MAENQEATLDALQLEPNTLPATGRDGEIRVDSADKNLKKWSDATSSWEIVGGGTGLNYITNDDFENDASGWADSGGTMSIARATSPSFGSVLRGTASGEITNGANADYIDYAFTLHDADTSRLLKISFDYETDNNFVDGDVKVVLRDVTNSNDIAVVPEDIQAGKGTFVGYAQTSADGTSYELRLVQVAETGPWATMNIDNVSVGPAPRQYAVPITGWESYTPSATTIGGASVTLDDAYYRRVGDSVECWVAYTLGAVMTGEVSDALSTLMPTGLTPDTTKYANTGVIATMPAGQWSARDESAVSTADNFCGILEIHTSGSGSIRLCTTNGNDYVDQNNPFVWAATDQITLHFTVPVQGWGVSQRAAEEATDSRVVAVIANNNGGESLTSATTDIDFSTTVKDTHAAWNVDKFTAPHTGYYAWAGVVNHSPAVSGISIDAYVDAVQSIRCGESEGTQIPFAGMLHLTKGEVLSFRASDNTTTAASSTAHNIAIWSVNGNEQVLASEAVLAVYYANISSPAMDSGVQGYLDFDTKVIDTHGSVAVAVGAYTASTGTHATSEWTFTVPRSGHLSVNIIARSDNHSIPADAVYSLLVQKNADTPRRIISENTLGAINGRIYLNASTIFDNVQAGDTIKIKASQNSGGAISMASTNNDEIRVEIRML